MSVEQYIAGLHNRLDKNATLNFDNKLKRHLLLRQDSLMSQNKNVLIGVVSESYDIRHLTAALRNCFINQPPSESTLNTQFAPSDYNNRPQGKRNNRCITQPSSTAGKNQNDRRFTITNHLTAQTTFTVPFWTQARLPMWLVNQLWTKPYALWAFQACRMV